MDAPFSSSLTSDLDRRVIAGWAAIEHGDRVPFTVPRATTK
jgi:hypothetical protein